MALKDLIGLIDNKLHSVFHKPVHDPVKARGPLLKKIEQTKAQFEKGSTKAPGRWWKASNNVVEFKPVLNGHPLLINGEEMNFVPAERFINFLDHLTSAVNDGEFDKELENHGEGTAKVAVPKAKGTRTYSAQSALNIRVGGFRRGGMSDKDIRSKLDSEGVDKALIDVSLARKPVKKA